MAIIKSSSDHLTINAEGTSKDIKFQANGVEKASISSTGAFTSTTIDATKLTGNLPAISGASLTGLPGGGAMELISTTVISTAVASVSFTSLADGIYKLIVHGQMTAAGGTCLLTPKDETGGTAPTFKSIASSKEASTYSVLVNTYFRPSGPAGMGTSGQEMFILDFMVKTNAVSFVCDYAGNFNTSTSIRGWSVSGSLSGSNKKITGWVISHSAGNLSAGSYSLYKIKES